MELAMGMGIRYLVLASVYGYFCCGSEWVGVGEWTSSWFRVK